MVIKTNKKIKGFRDFILVFAFVLTSVLLLHPSPPHPLGRMLLQNEGVAMRDMLKKLEINSPTLLGINKKVLIEEFIDGGNLYSHFEKKADPMMARKAGILTARLHDAKFVFLDNKAQNYLVNPQRQLVRTDLSFIMRESTVFSRSMDLATFLASIMDLRGSDYRMIQDNFISAYENEAGKPSPYLYIILRNILALGFSANRANTFMNLLKS